MPKIEHVCPLNSSLTDKKTSANRALNPEHLANIPTSHEVSLTAKAWCATTCDGTTLVLSGTSSPCARQRWFMRSRREAQSWMGRRKNAMFHKKI